MPHGQMSICERQKLESLNQRKSSVHTEQKYNVSTIVGTAARSTTFNTVKLAVACVKPPRNTSDQ